MVLFPPLKPPDPQSSLEKVCSPIPPFSPPPKLHDCLSIYGIFDLEDKVNFEEWNSDSINQEKVNLGNGYQTMLK